MNFWETANESHSIPWYEGKITTMPMHGIPWSEISWDKINVGEHYAMYRMIVYLQHVS